MTTARDAAQARADAAKLLLALAAAGLVVGAFLIANAFGIVLTQRARELALLRAAGATGRQVLASVLGEALLVGLTGAADGFAAGLGAAYALRGLGLGRGAGLAMPDGPLIVTPQTVLVALGASTLVTLLAALGPAHRAAHIAPVEAMLASDPTPAGSRRGRVITGWVLLGLGLVQLVAAGLLRDIAGVALGAVLLLAALVATGVTITGAIDRQTGLDPDCIADAYRALHTQPAAEWNAETIFDGK